MRITKFDELWIALVAFLFVGLFIYGLCSLLQTERAPRKTPSFSLGETVRLKLTKQKGMVTSVWCRQKCYYNIRMPGLQNNTNTHLFGNDSPIDISPLSLVTSVREFELEEIK